MHTDAITLLSTDMIWSLGQLDEHHGHHESGLIIYHSALMQLNMQEASEGACSTKSNTRVVERKR